MKTWTVVIEIKDDGIDGEDFHSKIDIENMVRGALAFRVPAEVSYSVQETIPAPYGPQHPDGVFISEVKK